ncbi:HutD family protein [Microbacterium oryzae]|uniref:HutD/Ves family protein n=1 Tax=Microbacterium oryzae TaxID=743009 RepID=UPI0025AFA775|nr:HutD family protein [Microbacterium oryzae]MDN3310741.1 HutD family protein [Microbacterium oryzae]
MGRQHREGPAIVRLCDVAPEAWSNGLGLTRVLVSRPAWRLSVAEIAGRAPFSALPGLDRVLIPLSDEGLVLDIEGEVHRVPRHTAISFRGENRVVAEAEGRAVRVFNVMVWRSAARVETVVGPTPPLDGASAVAVLSGSAAHGSGPVSAPAVILPADGGGTASCRPLSSETVLAAIRVTGRTGGPTQESRAAAIRSPF